MWLRVWIHITKESCIYLYGEFVRVCVLKEETTKETHCLLEGMGENETVLKIKIYNE